jgi:lysophospholipase L1-like esterase
MDREGAFVVDFRAMSQAIDQMPRSPAEFVCGAVETVEVGGEWTFHRFAPGQAAAYREAGLDDFFRKTFASAGVRLAFRTDAEALSFDYRLAFGSSRSFGFFDVLVDGALAAHGGLEEDDGARHAFAAELGPGEKNVEVYLPWSRQTFVSNFVLRRASFAEPLRRSRTMLCFGDSITQGYDAQYPSLAYAEAIARLLGADNTNKAIGGDRFFPALLEEPDTFQPDVVLVAYGTNDWSRCQPDDVRARAKAFYERLAALYPAARILAVTPLWRGDPPSHSPCGEDVRCIDRIIREACKDIPNAAVIHGYNLVPHLPEFFSDRRLHPNDIGFALYAQNLLREITA